MGSACILRRSELHSNEGLVNVSRETFYTLCAVNPVTARMFL